jgi:hypothetical protein
VEGINHVPSGAGAQFQWIYVTMIFLGDVSHPEVGQLWFMDVYGMYIVNGCYRMSKTNITDWGATLYTG